MSFGLVAYRSLTILLVPILRLILRRRLSRGKEDPNRICERSGVPTKARPDGLLIWIHAASVGESISVLPLVNAFVESTEAHVLVTTGSVTSARLMELRLPQKAVHQFIPIDQIHWVRSFLNHWQPDMAVFVESEFWPNLMLEIKERRIPAALVNARITEKSFRSWRFARSSIRELLSAFVVCLAQDAASAERLAGLGATHVFESGNLRHAAPPLPADEAAVAEFREQVRGRPIFLAASTHEGEEEIALAVHDDLIASFPSLLTVIVPRHPERGNMVAQKLLAEGRTIAQRSKADGLHEEVAIYLADTLGELGLFFRVAPITFLGGSFANVGGHNPLEPVRLGNALVHGPSTYNHSELYRDLHESHSAVQVDTAEDMATQVKAWLSDPKQAEELAENGKSYADRMTHVFIDVLRHLKPLIEKARHHREAKS